MKTFLIKFYGYQWTERAKGINEVRKKFMGKKVMNGGIAWVEDIETEMHGQVRFDPARQRFVWYRDKRTINVINKDGSLGRRI